MPNTVIWIRCVYGVCRWPNRTGYRNVRCHETHWYNFTGLWIPPFDMSLTIYCECDKFEAKTQHSVVGQRVKYIHVRPIWLGYGVPCHAVDRADVLLSGETPGGWHTNTLRNSCLAIIMPALPATQNMAYKHYMAVLKAYLVDNKSAIEHRYRRNW